MFPRITWLMFLHDQALLEQKLLHDDASLFYDQLLTDFSAQALQAQACLRQLDTWLESKDIEMAANHCRVLNDRCPALDIIVSHTSAEKLLEPLSRWLSGDSVGQNGKRCCLRSACSLADDAVLQEKRVLMSVPSFCLLNSSTCATR